MTIQLVSYKIVMQSENFKFNQFLEFRSFNKVSKKLLITVKS